MISIFALALKFFLVTNPIGNSPAILALVKDYDFSRQRFILVREAIISLLIALFFQFFGEAFLNLIHIKDYAVSLCGGILLFIVALNMIFAAPPEESEISSKQEPFIVPIATPILSGPGLMSIIMLNAKLEPNGWYVTLAILTAWVGVIFVLAISPYLQKVLGKRGLVALEQVMGMVLALMSVGMIVNGVTLFKNTLTF